MDPRRRRRRARPAPPAAQRPSRRWRRRRRSAVRKRRPRRDRRPRARRQGRRASRPGSGCLAVTGPVRTRRCSSIGRYPRQRVRVDEHTIEVAGSPAFFRSASAPGTPTVYLHGVPTSSDDWTGLLERTGGIAPDLPGFGRSGKGGHLEYSIGAQAEFVERLLDAAGLEQVQLVAHDWGAAAGLVFAQRNPQRVERIVLCNALPLLDGFHWHRLARAWRAPVVGELVMGAVNRRLLARTLRRGSASAEAWPDARVAPVWDQFDQGTQRAILLLHRSCDERQLAAAGTPLGPLP